MREQFSSLDLYKMVQELHVLAGARIDKVYAENEYLLWQVYTGSVRTNLKIIIPGMMYLTDHKPRFAPAKGFAMFLRRRLQKARIQSVEQLGFDRIVKMVITTPDDTYHVYIELFGAGNFIICDDQDVTISALRGVTFADRTIKRGEPYTPELTQKNIPDIPQEEFDALFGKDEAAKTLASEVGLGGEYASLLCAIADVDPKAKSPDTQKLWKTLQTLISQKASCTKDNQAFPFHIEGGEEKESFSQAIASVRDGLYEAAKREEKVKKVSKVQGKWESIMKAQEKQVKKLQKSREDNQEKGELIYKHYVELSELLKNAQKDRKSLSDEAFTKKYESHPLVVKADKLVIEVDLE